MQNNFMDAGTIGLMILFVTTVYGFFLFWWYWNRKGKATEAYVYMMSVYGTGSLPMGFGIYARWLRTIDRDAFEILLESNIWAIRLIPLIIAFVIITFRLSQKAYRSQKYEKSKYDRRGK